MKKLLTPQNIGFVLTIIAVSGLLKIKNSIEERQTLPPGAAQLSMPTSPQPPDVLSNVEVSRRLMSKEEKFNNDVNYDISLINPDYKTDVYTYQWGQWFCAMRSTGLNAGQIQQKTQEILDKEAPGDTEVATAFNVIYKRAITDLCP
jgi:hypothetical protein